MLISNRSQNDKAPPPGGLFQRQVGSSAPLRLACRVSSSIVIGGEAVADGLDDTAGDAIAPSSSTAISSARSARARNRAACAVC